MGNNYTKLIGTGVGACYQNSQDINDDYGQDITITKTIGRNGIGSKDYNFAAPADLLQQNLDLGLLLPPNCRIKSCSIKCVIALVGIADINMILGNVSAGNQLIISTSVNALNETIVNVANLPAMTNVPTKLFLGATPVTNTWDLATAGEWLLTFTYEDFSKN